MGNFAHVDFYKRRYYKHFNQLGVHHVTLKAPAVFKSRARQVSVVKYLQMKQIPLLWSFPGRDVKFPEN